MHPLADATPAQPSGRLALVTGAGSGIGLALAEALAREGWTVLAGARRADDLAHLATLPGVVPLTLDVRDPAQVEAAAAAVDAQGGRLDGLVHNAGVGELGPLAAWSDDDLLRLFDINVFGPHRLTRALLPALLAARGRVVCVGSMGGTLTQPLFGPYSMTKFALEAYAESLQRELSPYGVAVCIVQPGAVATRIGETARAPNVRRLQQAPPPFDVQAQEVLRAWEKPSTPRPDEPESATNRRPATPQAVAAVIQEALQQPEPRLRWLVGTRWEGRRVVDALVERLLDACTSDGQRLDRQGVHALIDLAWRRRHPDG